ncbi:MAG: low molecular weight protein-tyrosine-phosphatase [Cyclobacteriaceae bacterium]
MIKVLFVCLGNICRSPLAEAILNHKISDRKYQENISCDSCGTSDFHIGELPDERALACAVNNGLTLNHRGRQLHRTDFRDFDYLIAMDHSNFEKINQLATVVGAQPKNLRLMREFQESAEFLEVPDPYYGGEEGFQKVFEILDEAITGFLHHVEEKYQWNGKP